MSILDGFSKKYEKGSDASEDSPKDAIGDLFKRTLARVPSSQERQAIKDFCAAAIVELPMTPENCWQYGYGGISKDLKAVKSFKPLPLFSESKWMGLDGKLPDKKLGWIFLNATGGHPGEGLGRCAIRRWIAPRSGKIRVTGKLEHVADQGDGIHGIIIANKDKMVGNWKVHHDQAPTSPEPFEVEQGDTIDFIVSENENTNSDSFSWICQLQYEGDGKKFESDKHFTGTTLIALDRWQQAAQALLFVE